MVIVFQPEPVIEEASSGFFPKGGMIVSADAASNGGSNSTPCLNARPAHLRMIVTTIKEATWEVASP